MCHQLDLFNFSACPMFLAYLTDNGVVHCPLSVLPIATKLQICKPHYIHVNVTHMPGLCFQRDACFSH